MNFEIVYGFQNIPKVIAFDLSKHISYCSNNLLCSLTPIFLDPIQNRVATNIV